jgi:hypothetical protein
MHVHATMTLTLKDAYTHTRRTDTDTYMHTCIHTHILQNWQAMRDVFDKPLSSAKDAKEAADLER